MGDLSMHDYRKNIATSVQRVCGNGLGVHGAQPRDPTRNIAHTANFTRTSLLPSIPAKALHLDPRSARH